MNMVLLSSFTFELLVSYRKERVGKSLFTSKSFIFCSLQKIVSSLAGDELRFFFLSIILSEKCVKNRCVIRVLNSLSVQLISIVLCFSCRENIIVKERWILCLRLLRLCNWFCLSYELSSLFFFIFAIDLFILLCLCSWSLYSYLSFQLISLFLLILAIHYFWVMSRPFYSSASKESSLPFVIVDYDVFCVRIRLRRLG